MMRPATMKQERFRNLLGLMAFFATIVAAGSWDNRRMLQQVLDEGYPAVVQITGAQFTRFAPVAFDGWRPRFVEQNVAVDLKWEGKDGKPHEFKKVPISETFAATIISGEQVRLAILPAKAVDDPHLPPAINADASSRYASLQDWLKLSGYISVVGWLGFAGLTFWLMKQKSLPTSSPASAMALPPRRTLLGAVAFLVGAILVFRTGTTEGPSASGGIEASAEITTAATIAGGNNSTRIVQVSWKDTRGSVRHYGPIKVSEAFWNKITKGGALAVHETRIRYKDDGSDAKPVLVEDRDEGPWSEYALAGGFGLIAFGAFMLLSAARIARRGIASDVKKGDQTLKK